jgi:GxxExxY protein
MNDMRHGTLAAKMLGLAREVQETLGYDRSREEYIEALDRIFTANGLALQRKVWLPENYKGIVLQCGHEADLVVEDRIAVLVNQSDDICEDEERLLACLRLGGYIAGLLFNFHERIPEKGVQFLAYGVPALCWAENHSSEA